MTQSSAVAIPPSVLPTAETSRPRPLFQAIPAEFYNVSDDDGNPIAGLLVLNDSTRHPVRAELHLVGATTDSTGRLAIRQAQRILEERYRGPEQLPMQVWQSFLRSDPLAVPLPPADKGKKAAPAPVAPVAKTSRARLSSTTASLTQAMPWKLIATAAGVLMLALMLWGIVAWLRSGNEEVVTPGPAVGGIAAPAEEGAAIGSNTAATGDPVLDAPPPAPVAAELKTSVHADPTLMVGTRVRLMPKVQALTLRTEPGHDAGQVVGYMEDDMEAIIIGGPTQLPGVSDTIVWWQVQMDDGKEAWAAANTSDLTLLEPVD